MITDVIVPSRPASDFFNSFCRISTHPNSIRDFCISQLCYTAPISPAQQIDNLINSLADWRGPMLARCRQLFHDADPQVLETWKWMGTPVWEHEGIIAAGMAFKTSIKIGFLYGAHLPDPEGIFNDELKGNQRRAIKLFEGDTLNEVAFIGLIRAAVQLNTTPKP